jgi:hypothetical protein
MKVSAKFARADLQFAIETPKSPGKATTSQSQIANRQLNML